MKQIWAIVAALEECYGAPELGNRSNPLDELVFIIVSARTREETYLPVFLRIRKEFSKWDKLTRENQPRLTELIRPAGLARKKSEAILAALEVLRREYGVATLEPARNLPDDLLEAYLLGLPGVDRKTARCIMLFSFGRQVLPVDTHVFRISRRLGLTDRNRADLAHYDLDLAIPPALRHVFHVACVSHGRQVCRAKDPKCRECCITGFCQAWIHSSQIVGVPGKGE